MPNVNVDNDPDVVVVGVANEVVLPHFRFHCLSGGNCPQCYCYCCDAPLAVCCEPARHVRYTSEKDEGAAAERARTLAKRAAADNLHFGCSCTDCNKLTAWWRDDSGAELRLELPTWQLRAHVMDALDRVDAAAYRVEGAPGRLDLVVKRMEIHKPKRPRPAVQLAVAQPPRRALPRPAALQLGNRGFPPPKAAPRPSRRLLSRPRAPPIPPPVVTNVSTNARLKLTSAARPAAQRRPHLRS